MTPDIRSSGRPAAGGLYLSVDGRCTGLVVRRADTFVSRAIGMLGRRQGSGPLALEIRPCSAIHTCGMRQAIDVAFVDGHGRVQRLVEGLPAWRAAWSPGARAAWELPAGAVQALGIERGTELRTTVLMARHGRTHVPAPVPPRCGAPAMDGGR
jgi:uncharacterized membrane protein (UPF0127 family)